MFRDGGVASLVLPGGRPRRFGADVSIASVKVGVVENSYFQLQLFVCLLSTCIFRN